jgi:glutathione-regulated potassium-efflux system ancillary protein KefG
MQTLVVFCHPNVHTSKINAPMIQASNDDPSITVTDLYAKYPDFKINVETEQDLLTMHNKIVLQFPLYWYNSPALLKQYLDSVLSYGWAFGDKMALKGKTLCIAATAGGTKDAYQENGKNKHTMQTLLTPFEATANFIGMKYEKPFITYGVYAMTEKQIQARVIDYLNYVKG